MSKKPSLKLVSANLFLEESTPWKIFSVIILLIAIAIILLIIWATFAKVNETAKAFGKIIPENKIDIIEHLEGGIIDKVLIKNGAQVKRGQTLLTLSTSKADSQLKQLITRRTNLLLNQIRLEALLNNTPEKQINWKSAFSGNSLTELEQKELLDQEISTLNRQKLNQEQQIQTLRYQIEKYQTDIIKYKQQKISSEENLVSFMKELGMYKRLVKKGYVSKSNYLAIQRNVSSTKAELQTMISNLNYAKSQVQEYQTRLEQLKSKFASDYQLELDKIAMQLSELEHQIAPLKDEVIRHTIKSPVNGIVNTFELKKGNVIEPGEKLLEIVPNTQGVVITARLSTTDVGHVKVGDPTKIKVLTYDYSRYGILNGKVINIAANSKATKQGTPFYEVTIKPKKNYVDNNKELKLKPGMTVEADIITGEKTVLAYLLNPIHRSFSKALTER